MTARALRLPRMHPDGYVYVGGAAAAALLGFLVWSPLAWAGAAGAVVSYLAFRRPDRVTPLADDLLVAPVDGVVEEARPGVAPPVEMNAPAGAWTLLRISCAPWAPCAVRAPAAGRVAGRAAAPAGRFALAHAPGGADVGRGALLLETAAGPVGVVISHGGFGPRLRFEVEADALVDIGEEIAARRFGGWCDVYLPAGVSVVVSEGQTLLAGETPIAVTGEGEPLRTVRR